METRISEKEKHEDQKPINEDLGYSNEKGNPVKKSNTLLFSLLGLIVAAIFLIIFLNQ